MKTSWSTSSLSILRRNHRIIAREQPFRGMTYCSQSHLHSPPNITSTLPLTLCHPIFIKPNQIPSPVCVYTTYPPPGHSLTARTPPPNIDQ